MWWITPNIIPICVCRNLSNPLGEITSNNNHSNAISDNKEISPESSENNPLLPLDDGEGSFEHDSTEPADDNSGSSNTGAEDMSSNNDQLPYQWENFVNENHYVLNRDDEKIYEDLCYVTFSSSLPKVYIANMTKYCFFFLVPLYFYLAPSKYIW